MSVSGMRTGDLSAQQDKISAMWFANGWFRSIGSTNTTTFQANLVEGDIQCRFRHTALQAFGGYIHYDDNDPSANNGRDVYYYCVEGVQDVIGKLYAAARFSQIFARNGFPLVGDGTMGDYFYGSLTDQLWRLGLGLGYRFDRRLILKIEYAFEQGTEVSGEVRDHENLFATQVAFAF